MALVRRPAPRGRPLNHVDVIHSCGRHPQYCCVARQLLGMARRLAWRSLPLWLGIARLGLGLLRMGLWIRLGMGLVGARLGRVGPFLDVAYLLLQPMGLRSLAVCRQSRSLRARSLSSARVSAVGERMHWVPQFWPTLPEVGTF